MLLRGLPFLALAASALEPAWAGVVNAARGPSDALLFGMGVAGLLIGRYAARHRPDD